MAKINSRNRTVNCLTIELTRCQPSSRTWFRVGMMACLGMISLAAFGTEEVSGATFRVDDSTLTVPAIHNDNWRALKVRKTWTRADGEEIPDDPRFVRFLARDYEFSLSSGALRMKTTWFAARKCVSTDELVSSLGSAKRKAIEEAFGPLNEMNRRLQGATADGVEGRVVIWAHFRAKSDVSLPIGGLASDDQEVLAPFADLAKQSFETRLFDAASSCKESKVPRAARSAARSGGRRMPSSSRSKPSSVGRRPLPTGGVVRGETPQGSSPAATGIVRDEDEVDTRKQKWGFTISMYMAKPGSLSFRYAGQFSRCIEAGSQAGAMAVLRSMYRSTIAAGTGKRVSYIVQAGHSTACQQSGGGGGSTALPSNFEERPKLDDLLVDGATGAGGGVATAVEGGLSPFPDPLSFDPAATVTGEFPELDDFDFESIPVIDDFAGDLADSAETLVP